MVPDVPEGSEAEVDAFMQSISKEVRALMGTTAPPHKGKPLDLDPRVDSFWGLHAHAAFPEAIEANDRELTVRRR